jgi:hypothetical protein
MTRLLSAAAAFAATATLFIVAPVQAQTVSYYVAVPAAQATKATLITRSTPWVLRGNAYLAARAPERTLVLCQTLARSVGKLQSFTAGGTPLDAETLDKCNTRARAMPATAMAATR